MNAVKRKYDMCRLFDTFPYLESDILIIRKMSEDDVDALSEITSNDNVYRYIPPFLYKKSRGNLLAAIRNTGGRDFDKKKAIIAGIYLKSEPGRLIGLAEIFDYKKRLSQVTVGYRINEDYWHRGIATETIRLLVEYLCGSIKIDVLKAFVMPDNVYSVRALLKNGFIKEPDLAPGHNWGGRESVSLDVFAYRKAISEKAVTANDKYDESRDK